MKRVKKSLVFFVSLFPSLFFSLSLSLRKTSFSSTRRRRSTRSPRLSRGVNATLVLLLDESKVVVYTLFVMIVIVFVLLRETLFSFFYEETARIFESKHKIISLTWPTLKTSRDINSNETREENDINRRIFSVRITRARLVSFYSLLCASRERQRRSILAFSLVFFVCFGKNASLAAANFHI